MVWFRQAMAALKPWYAVFLSIWYAICKASYAVLNACYATLKTWYAALLTERRAVREYDAFISYSHAKDKTIAVALQSAMQRLGKPWYQRRALRIFRDDACLAANPNLWGSIESALKTSRHLILLASPCSANSRWVAQEVAFWLEHKSIETLFIGLTERVPEYVSAAETAKTPGSALVPEAASTCPPPPAGHAVSDTKWSVAIPMPAVLKDRFPTEPKWVDLQKYRAGARMRDRQFMLLVADFAAAVHGIPKEDLLSEEVLQQRIALTLAVGAAISLFVIAGVAIAERNRAENTLSAATVGANKLVLDVAVKLRETIGIPIDVVRTILDHVKDLQGQLIEYNERDPNLRRSRAIALRETSQTLLEQGDRDAALLEAQKSRKLMDALRADHPANPEIKREFSRTLNRIGEALSSLGRNQEALDHFRESLTIRQELAASIRGIEPQRDLALSFERVADELYNLGDDAAALRSYQSCFAIRAALARTNPDQPQQQADLATSYDRLARLRGYGEAALEFYRKSLKIRQKLTEDEPRNSDWQRALAATYEEIGKILLASDKREEAIASFRESLRIREQLANANPEKSQWQGLHALSLYFLGNAGDQPKERYTLALQILRRLGYGKLPANLRDLPAEIEMRLNELVR